MKFLAMLRDSLRETLDVKLFYVMVGLSLLVVLLAASVTYKPVPMKQRIEFENNFVNMMIRGQMQARPETAQLDFHIDIEDFEQLDGPPEPWLADYHFFYTITMSAPAQEGGCPIITSSPPPGRS